MYLGCGRRLGECSLPPMTGRGAAPAGVVVSYAFWQGQLAGDPQAVGRTLTIGRHRGSDRRSDASRFYWSGSRPLV